MKSRAILWAGAAAIALAAASVSGREAAPSFRTLDRATVEAIAQRSHRSLSDEERQELNATIKAGLDFRAWMAGNPEGLRAALTPPEAAVLDALIAAGGAPSAAPWRDFFRGSIIAVGHATSERPRIGYYYPLVDGWVIGDFTRSAAGGLTLESLHVVAGNRIAETPRQFGEVRPPWLLRPDMAMPSSLALATAANMAAFERAWPPLAATAAAQPLPAPEPALIVRRLLLTATTVRSFIDDPAYMAVADGILDAIRRGDGVALMGMTGRPPASHALPVQRIGALSAPARRTFELRGIYRNRDGMSVVFGSPYSGNWLVFADLQTGGQSPKLTDIVAVDLGQLE